ncbi:MAG: hypothetical protein JO054_05685 [Actinobacteria bacterium]|nr:hypothetical protein [Actinomycetota bacterium]
MSNSASVSSTVVVSFTDSAGAATPLTTTGVITGPWSLPLTVPVKAAAGAGFVNVTTSSGTTSLLYLVNTPTETAATLVSSSSPVSVTRGTTVTITTDNFAPGQTITPTLVYSDVASTGGMSVTPGTPIVVPAAGGPSTQVLTLPKTLAYGTTGTFSVTASYPVTPTFPTFTANPAPTFSVSPAATSAVGVSQTLSLSSTSTGGFNITGSPGITFVIGLKGQPASAIVPTSLVADSATGIFTATLQFTPTVVGTYVITASDLGLNNQAASTFDVAVPAAPVATAYLAEGYTGGAGSLAFHTLLNILNPNVVPVVVTDTYLLETASANVATTTVAAPPDVVVVTHTLAALTDATVDVASDIGSRPVSSGPDAGKLVSGTNQRVATEVQTAGFSSNPSVRGAAVERIIERLSGGAAAPSFADGDVALATSSPNTSYYFSEGYTGITFQEYLILFNPSPTVTATVNVMPAPENAVSAKAPTPLGPYVLAPLQRITLNMRALNKGNPPAIGLIVNSDHAIVAGRTLYFGSGSGSAKQGMTNSQGLTTAAKQFNFAYGSLTGPFDVANPVTGTIVPTSDAQQTIDDRPFISVMNPAVAGQVSVGASAAAAGPSAHVTISLRGEDGKQLGFFITDVDPGTRFTLTDADLTSGSGGVPFPGVPSGAPTRAGVFSAIVSSSSNVVAELANYYGQGPNTPSGDANAGAPGISLVGAPSGETDVVFPALGTSEAVAGKPVSSTVFLYNPGVNAITVQGTYFGASGLITTTTYTVGADQIQVIGAHLTDSGGTGAAAGSPMPAGTLGAEFSVSGASALPGQAAQSFVAAAVSHSGDASNWWGTQGYYPLPSSCSAVTGCP